MTSLPKLAETSKSKPTKLSEETPEEAEDKEEEVPDKIEEKEVTANPESVNNKRRKRKRLLKTLLSRKRPKLMTRLLPSVKAEEEVLVKVNSDVLF